MNHRVTDDRRIWKAFRRHSRTFSMAARLLPRAIQLPVAVLYLFCRSIDEIADHRILEVGAAKALTDLQAMRRKLDATLSGRPPDELLWKRLAGVHAAYEFVPEPLYELIDGAAWDLRGRGIDTSQDLIAYSNLVGGSVGAMMLPFLTESCSDARALAEPARALGIAMQITNIVRDVGEDYRLLQRLYLPRTWLLEHGLTTDDLDAAAPTDAYPFLLEKAMEMAEAFYGQSEAGIAALPRRMRMGIYGAARMYREIMNEVRARNYDNLNYRAFVPATRKLRVVLHDDYDRRKQQLLSVLAYTA